MTAHPQPPRCDVCSAYWTRRSMVVARHTVAIARARGIKSADLARAYIGAVHARHLAGLSLDTS